MNGLRVATNLRFLNMTIESNLLAFSEESNIPVTQSRAKQLTNKLAWLFHSMGGKELELNEFADIALKANIGIKPSDIKTLHCIAKEFHSGEEGTFGAMLLDGLEEHIQKTPLKARS